MREIMKKLLLASTALVLSAGLANAQALNITGEGRMGVQGSNQTGTWVWNLENRLTLNFNVSVQADHGLTFGAWARARTGNTYASPISGSRVWVEANGLRVTFGNQDGAIRQSGVAFGYAGGCGVGYEGGQQCLDSVGLLSSHGQNSTGPDNEQMAQLQYTMGDTRVNLSHGRTTGTELGIRTSFDAFTVAFGYGRYDAGTIGTVANGDWTVTGVSAVQLFLDDTITLSARYNGGSWSVGAIVARISTVAFQNISAAGVPLGIVAANNTWTNWQINGSVALGGGTVYGFAGRVYDGNVVGVNYGYGLGGGATLSVGAEHIQDQFGVAGNDITTASLGVAFNF
jgi:outer membrane protein OmpU